jgi:hypothetical protein
MSTPKRLPYNTLSPEAYQGFGFTKKALEKSSLGKQLIELAWLRMPGLGHMHAPEEPRPGRKDAKVWSTPSSVL